MKTLVVCGNPHNGESHRVRELIKAKFDANVILAPFNSFERQIVVAAPDLVLVVLGENSEPGLGALHRSRQCHKGLLVAVGPASDPQLILRSLQEGADNYLDVNAIESNLGAVVARLGQKEEGCAHDNGSHDRPAWSQRRQWHEHDRRQHGRRTCPKVQRLRPGRSQTRPRRSRGASRSQTKLYDRRHFQARNVAHTLQISGNGIMNITGAVYAPAAHIQISGNGTVAAKLGSSFIGRTMQVSGNGDIVVDPQSNSYRRAPTLVD